MKTEREKEIRVLVEEKRWEDLADCFVVAVQKYFENSELSNEELDFILSLMRSERLDMIAKGVGDSLVGDGKKMSDYEKSLRERGDDRDADWYKVGILIVNLLLNLPEDGKTVWVEGIVALSKKVEALMKDKLDIRQKVFATRVCWQVKKAVGVVETE